MASWFYLTLWHGTPPEMTEHLEATINVRDGHCAEVVQNSKHSESVQNFDKSNTTINETDRSSAVVLERNEVTLVVGKKH